MGVHSDFYQHLGQQSHQAHHHNECSPWSLFLYQAVLPLIHAASVQWRWGWGTTIQLLILFWLFSWLIVYSSFCSLIYLLFDLVLSLSSNPILVLRLNKEGASLISTGVTYENKPPWVGRSRKPLHLTDPPCASPSPSLPSLCLPLKLHFLLLRISSHRRARTVSYSYL